MSGMIEDMNKESRQPAERITKDEHCKKCETMKHHIERVIERNREEYKTTIDMIARYEVKKIALREEYARLSIMLEMCEEEKSE